jgi:hypothetical protein
VWSSCSSFRFSEAKRKQIERAIEAYEASLPEEPPVDGAATRDDATP